jgi:hypothetical protein
MAKQYIVEARDKDGALVTDPAKQPPFGIASENQLADHYFIMNEERSTTDMGVIENWFESKGWFIRERTW